MKTLIVSVLVIVAAIYFVCGTYIWASTINDNISKLHGKWPIKLKFALFTILCGPLPIILSTLVLISSTVNTLLDYFVKISKNWLFKECNDKTRKD